MEPLFNLEKYLTMLLGILRSGLLSVRVVQTVKFLGSVTLDSPT